jgi:hypothetical protein
MCGRIEIELYLLLGLQLGPSRQSVEHPRLPSSALTSLTMPENPL